LKILIDQNVSARLARLLPGHDVVHASRKGWAELTNGDLLTAAEIDGFEVMITADQNIRYQQNLAGRRIALLVLSTNQLDILFANVDRICAALDQVTTGAYMVVGFDRPPLLRRPYPPTSD
jgi:predicted nuclease of predicted toxin-antitoxin system